MSERGQPSGTSPVTSESQVFQEEGLLPGGCLSPAKAALGGAIFLKGVVLLQKGPSHP